MALFASCPTLKFLKEMKRSKLFLCFKNITIQQSNKIWYASRSLAFDMLNRVVKLCKATPNFHSIAHNPSWHQHVLFPFETTQQASQITDKNMKPIDNLKRKLQTGFLSFSTRRWNLLKCTDAPELLTLNHIPQSLYADVVSSCNYK